MWVPAQESKKGFGLVVVQKVRSKAEVSGNQGPGLGFRAC